MMPDGNTAALRAHEAQQDRADKRHSAYGDRVIDSIIEDLEDGKKVGRRTIHDFVPEIDHDETTCLLYGDEEHAELVKDRLKKQTVEAIREWCQGDGADYVAEREQEWQESDEADAAEARAAARGD